MKNLKLIADSGSTQCDWILSNNGEIILELTTVGINPFYQTESEISAIIATELLPHIDIKQIGSVYFYGAGCAFPEKNEIVKRAIEANIPDTEIEVNSDLLAAARSLCGKEPGIVCILGTGSNSCFYDGEKIKKNVPSLGFILGDEGSGADIGKIFIGNLLKNQFPTYIYDKFINTYNTSPEQIMECVYRKPFPNRYLAQYTKFVVDNIREPRIYDLVFNVFSNFITRNVMQYDYQIYPIYFTGSVAFHFESILRKACLENRIWPGEITESPIKGLLGFHK